MVRNGIILAFFLFGSMPVMANIDINFQQAKASEVIQTYSKAILKRDYVLGSDFNDVAPVTVSLKNKTQPELVQLFDSLLTERGIYKKELAGVLYFSKTPNQDVQLTPFQIEPLNELQQLALDTPEPPPPINPQVYQPMHIQPSELVELLAIFNIKSIVRGDGYIVYAAEKRHELGVHNLFKRLDVPNFQYEVIAATYEVTKGDDSFRSIDLIGEVFKNLSVSIVTGGASNIIRYAGGSLLSAFKFFDSDARFRAISKPYARVKSGGKLQFSSGQDVPILGNIVTTNNVTTQGIEYRKSGVILDVELRAVKDAIDVKINHELSSFVPTKTGVNNSPTLNKRSLKTDLTMKDSEIVVIGGLTDISTSTTSTNALGLFPIERIKTQKDTETYIMLQINKI